MINTASFELPTKDQLENVRPQFLGGWGRITNTRGNLPRRHAEARNAAKSFRMAHPLRPSHLGGTSGGMSTT
jgi:hypothetical protein